MVRESVREDYVSNIRPRIKKLKLIWSHSGFCKMNLEDKLAVQSRVAGCACAIWNLKLARPTTSLEIWVRGRSELIVNIRLGVGGGGD